MAITYVGAGAAVQTGTTTLTLAGHASSLIGDIHIAQIISINNVAVTAPNATWTEIAQLNFTGSRGAIFWKRLAAAGAGSYAFTVGGTTTSHGIVTAYRGCKATGAPFGAVTTSANASADAITYAAILPHTRNGMLVAVGLYAEDATTAGTVSGAVYVFAAPVVDEENATLEDSWISVSHAPMTTNATSGAITQATTSTVDAVNLGVLFDLMDESSLSGVGGGGLTYPAGMGVSRPGDGRVSFPRRSRAGDR